MAEVKLDPSERAALATAVLSGLEQAIPGSVAGLQGSLAAGDADPWSDIDVDWEVPAGALASAASQLGRALARIRPVESVRVDPAFAHSPVLSLAFVRFADTPLFWRVDVTIRQRAGGPPAAIDLTAGSAEQPQSWSVVESALATVVSVARAHLRGRADYAVSLIRRAASLVGARGAGDTDPPGVRLRRVIEEANKRDPGVSALAGRVEQLVGEVFG